MHRLFSQVAMWLVLLMTIWLAGLGWFVQQIPKKETAASIANADAIVLLTGGKGRLEHALDLLAENKAPVLFISGASKNVKVGDMLRHTPPEIQLAIEKKFGSQPPIILGHEAENTIGNATETKQWLSETRYKTIFLVTSNYHMPRALGEFYEYLPDVSVVPAPVFPGDFSMDGGMPDADDRALLMSEYHKYIASKLRHAFLSLDKKS